MRIKQYRIEWVFKGQSAVTVILAQSVAKAVKKWSETFEQASADVMMIEEVSKGGAA